MLGKWVFLIEHWETTSPPLCSVFQGGCPDLGNNLAPSPSTFSDNALCTGAPVRVPTVRVMSATSVTRAVGSPPLA